MGIFSFLFGRKDVAGPTQRVSQSVPSKNRADTDWPSSNAHLSLLSRFLFACDVSGITKYEMDDTMKESTERALDRFIAEGWLIPASLSAKLSHAFNGTTIRALLKERGLPVSGRKDQGIERLVAADSDGMAAKIAHLKLYECSPKARALVAPIVSAEQEKRQTAEEKRPAAEARSFEQLHARDFRGASLTVANFEAEQVSPRGVNVKWKNYDPSNDVAKLEAIFSGKPKILSRLTNEQLDALRVPAAMMELWGVSTCEKWIPRDFCTDLAIDNNTAARMLMFFAMHRANIDDYKKSGVVKYIEILSSEDPCDTCKKLSKKKYRLNDTPELPHEHCTHEMGCRCDVVAVTTAR